MLHVLKVNGAKRKNKIPGNYYQAPEHGFKLLTFWSFMCKQCEDCSKEHQYDGLAGVDFVEQNEFI